MKLNIPDVTGSLVLSKHDCCFEEVIAQIPRSEKVSVVTYNVSNDQVGLLDVLRQCDAEVRLITNIPRRFEVYTSEYARKNARRNIAKMFRRLNPDSFGPLARTLFCFRNHAKIVMADSVAYVGSANYSEESSISWEAGVIVRDKIVLENISHWVDQIETDSIRFYGNKMQRVVSPLLVAKSQLDRFCEVFASEFTNDDVDSLIEVIQGLEETVLGVVSKKSSEHFER